MLLKFSPIYVALALPGFVVSEQAQLPLTQPESFIEKSIFARQPSFDASCLHSEESQIHAYDAFSENTPYSGIAYFAHLNASSCFTAAGDETFDIAIVGAPFDLGVSYRPGARFGPAGARMGSRRLTPAGGFSTDHLLNPFRDWATVVDCGDIANSPFDKLQAIQELEAGWTAIAARKVKNTAKSNTPRIISIGGDHTISLPALRALNKTWGPVALIHFDSHLDSWNPKQLGGGLTKYSEINHGSMFHIAHEEGLLSNNSNMHLGIRCALFDRDYDLDHDTACGFSYIRAREIDSIGIKKIVERVVQTVGGSPVYLSVDIDVLDPAFAPATGTIEPGGWTTRELLQILVGLSDAGVKIVGADVVEFAPAYDNSAETTAIMITSLIYEILQWMVKVPVSKA